MNWRPSLEAELQFRNHAGFSRAVKPPPRATRLPPVHRGAPAQSTHVKNSRSMPSTIPKLPPVSTGGSGAASDSAVSAAIARELNNALAEMREQLAAQQRQIRALQAEVRDTASLRKQVAELRVLVGVGAASDYEELGSSVQASADAGAGGAPHAPASCSKWSLAMASKSRSCPGRWDVAMATAWPRCSTRHGFASSWCCSTAMCTSRMHHRRRLLIHFLRCQS